MLCDSESAVYKIPRHKLDELYVPMEEVTSRGSVDAAALQKIAAKCMSMKAARRTASLWMYFMSKGIKVLDKKI